MISRIVKYVGHTITKLANQIVVNQIVEVVNRAIEADPSAMRALFENRVPCNQRLRNDPTIQVATEDENIGPTVGLLGILSGIAGTFTYKGKPNWSRISAVYNVDCPIHGNDLKEKERKVGDICPKIGCNEKLILGDLLRIEET